MTAIYLVVGVVAVGWFVLHHIGNGQSVGSVIEVDSLDEVYSDLSVIEDSDVTLIYLAIALSVSLLGIATSLVLVVGVMRKSSCCLLPWLVWHVVIILGCIGLGLYMVIYFTLLANEKEIVKSVVSIGPILAGIFLIFLWVLVDQLYIKLKQTRVTIEVEDPLKRSISTLNMMNKHKSHTMRSNKSTMSQLSTRSLRSVKRHQKRQREFYFKPDISTRKSRSMEYILDSTSDSSNSTYQSEIISRKLQGITTLPRLRRCQDNPNTFRAYMNCSPSLSSSQAGHTDTMRSCRSINSVKSVSIHPQVTEYHYSMGDGNREDMEEVVELGEGYHSENEDNSKGTVLEIYESLPAPIYPTLNGKNSWKSKLSERRKSFTKDQIIDLYCSKDVK